MTTQQKIDAFLDKYFKSQDNITQQFRRLIQNPSRHLLPPMPTKDGEYTDDRMLRIAGQLIGFSYLRTYITDTHLYVLRCVVIDDKVVYISVGAKVGNDWVDKDTEYFFQSDPYVNGVVLNFITDDTDQCVRSFKAAVDQLIVAGNELVELKAQQAYATYRDVKNYMESEMRAAANNLKYQ